MLQYQSELQTVVLDKNSLFDDGVIALFDGIMARFDKIEKMNNPSMPMSFGRSAASSNHQNQVTVMLPLTTLSISSVSMSEVGFKYLIQCF